MHRCGVVGGPGLVAAHDEAAVLGLTGQPVLEDDHGADNLGALHVADVEALDAQGCVVQPQCVLDLLECLTAGGEVTSPGHLVSRQALRRVAGHRLHERALVTTLRNAQVDPASPQARQPVGQGRRVVREDGNEHLTRNGLTGLRAVDPLKQVLDDLGGRLGIALGDPAPLPAHAPSPHVEELHGNLQLVLGEGEHVGIRRVGQHHGRLLQDPLQRADVVAQAGGALEVQLGRGILHLAGEASDEAAGLACHEVAEVLGDLTVALGVDPPHTRCAALVDVPEQAGTTHLTGPLEHPGRARAHGKHAQGEIEGLADGPRVGVRAEVPGALALGPPQHLGAGELLPHGHRQVGV